MPVQLAQCLTEVEVSLGPGGWFEKNMQGSKLIGLTVFYSTPHPEVTGYYEALYRVRWLSDPPQWGKYERDDGDGGAADDRVLLGKRRAAAVRIAVARS